MFEGSLTHKKLCDLDLSSGTKFQPRDASWSAKVMALEVVEASIDESKEAPRGGDQHPLLRPPAPPFFNARTRCETTAARSVSLVKTFEELFIFTLFYLTIF